MDYIKELAYINRSGFGNEEAHLLFSSISSLEGKFENMEVIDRVSSIRACVGKWF